MCLYQNLKKKKKKRKKEKEQKIGRVYTYQSCKTSVTLSTVSGVISLPMAKSTSNCKKKKKQVIGALIN